METAPVGAEYVQPLRIHHAPTATPTYVEWDKTLENIDASTEATTATLANPRVLSFNAPASETSTVIASPGFWSSAYGVILRLTIIRLPLGLGLLGIVATTHTDWWAGLTTASISMQQTMTAVVGIFVTLLIRDSAWMVQGALAAMWAYKKVGIPLAVSEAIQSGHPAIIFNTATSFSDHAIILAVPTLCIVLSAVYKFGITVESNMYTLNTTVRTTLLSQPLDSRPVVTPNCSGRVEPCKAKWLMERWGWKISAADLKDFSYAPGVVFGGAKENSAAYQLIVGDVPSIDFSLKRLAVGGVSYTQVFINATMDCIPAYGEPSWNLDCMDTLFNSSIPPNSVEGEAVDFTICQDFTESRYKAILTFRNSFRISCKYENQVMLRNVTAYPAESNWRIEERSKPWPIGSDILYPNRHGMKYFMPRNFAKMITRIGDKTCIQDNVCTTGDVDNDVALSVASFTNYKMTEWVYWFLHSDRDDEEKLEEPFVPFQGRVLLETPNSWREVAGPNGFLNVSAGENSRALVGATALITMQENSYVLVTAWTLFFLLLIPVYTFAAVVKNKYQSHPYESVGGMIWTLRKVEPAVALRTHKMRIAELLDFFGVLRLEKNSIKISRGGMDSSNRQSRVLSSAFVYDPCGDEDEDDVEKGKEKGAGVAAVAGALDVYGKEEVEEEEDMSLFATRGSSTRSSRRSYMT
ncbi:hypothetical protein HDU97_004279 [Phlyctochytrium planicorne]|nr:hypothetical protein HDU97_004279 [Phlyctochytrium planicorne]